MTDLKNIKSTKVAVIGLGYVGLPLAVEFGKHFETRGFDINASRIAELNAGHDSTLEVSEQELADSEKFTCTANLGDLKDSNVYIVTVPTPIDSANRPFIEMTPAALHALGKPEHIVYDIKSILPIDQVDARL